MTQRKAAAPTDVSAPAGGPPESTRRACAVCGARLSTYNEHPTCFAHTIALPWNGPSTRPR